MDSDPNGCSRGYMCLATVTSSGLLHQTKVNLATAFKMLLLGLRYINIGVNAYGTELHLDDGFWN